MTSCCPAGPRRRQPMDEPNVVATTPQEALEQVQNFVDGEGFIQGQGRKSWLFVYDTLINPALFSRYVKGIAPGKVVSVPSFKLSFPFHYPPAGTALPTIERA